MEIEIYKKADLIRENIRKLESSIRSVVDNERLTDWNYGFMREELIKFLQQKIHLLEAEFKDL